MKLKNGWKYPINVIIGLIILFGLHSLEKTKIGEGVLNQFFDISIKYFEDDKNFVDRDILFVDISHNDYLKWNRPYFIPYDSIANIIKFASENGAKQVIVDIDCDIRKAKIVSTNNLFEVINELSAKNDSMKVIFPIIRNPYENKIQESFLDTIVFQNGKIYQAIPQFAKSGIDQKIRYAKFYTHVTGKNKSFHWSVPLLSTSLNNDFENELNEKLQFNLMQNPNELYKIKKEQGTIYLSNNDLFVNRLKFKFRGKYEGPNWIPNLSFENRLEYSIFKEFPNYFKNKIVILGSSAPEFGDIHKTPIGMLPGMYIIGNAIEMLINYKQIIPPPILPVIIVEIVIIILMSFFYDKYDSFPALIFSFAFIIIIVGPFTFWLYYNYGIFINIILPVISMRVIMYITEMKNLRNNWRKK